MNIRGIQKKRPKNSLTSKKIQTHEFVGKNNKKTASGGLRPPWGGPSGHFPSTPIHLADAEIQILRPCNNQITTTNPNFPEI